MQLNSLRYFVAVAELCNYTKAAEQLFVSQPTLSRAISDLEDEFGVKLFYRTSRHTVILTPEGKICLEESRHIIECCEALGKRLIESSSHNKSTLHISYSENAYHSIIAPAERCLLKYNPKVELSIQKRPLMELNYILERDRTDCIITYRRYAQMISGVNIAIVQNAPFCFVCPDFHRYAKRASVSFDEIVDEAYINLSPELVPVGYNYLSSSLGSDMAGQINCCCTVGDTYSQLAMIAAGKGCALLSGALKGNEIPGISFVPIEEDFANDGATDVVVAYKKNNNNPVLERFLYYIKKHIAP